MAENRILYILRNFIIEQEVIEPSVDLHYSVTIHKNLTMADFPSRQAWDRYIYFSRMLYAAIVKLSAVPQSSVDFFPLRKLALERLNDLIHYAWNVSEIQKTKPIPSAQKYHITYLVSNLPKRQITKGIGIETSVKTFDTMRKYIEYILHCLVTNDYAALKKMKRP